MADIAKKRLAARVKRHSRIRAKVSGTAERPRLCVRRTLKNMIVQIVDDVNGVSLSQINTNSKDFKEANGSLSRTEQAAKAGVLIAQKTKEKGINQVVFDRGGYIFHGRVKAVADGAREAGLEF
jgi:large subunit ribosomal protein L18